MIREAVRALVLDENDRILLDRRESLDAGAPVWATPGGGIEPGESHEQALRRELAEELGLRGFPSGPEVWWREHRLAFGDGFTGQREHFYVVRVVGFVVGGRPDEGVSERCWWTLDELAATSERLAPRRLPAFLHALLRDGPPEQPLDVGV